jgi:hypothetical protein
MLPAQGEMGHIAYVRLDHSGPHSHWGRLVVDDEPSLRNRNREGPTVRLITRSDSRRDRHEDAGVEPIEVAAAMAP